jgi:hypothetical protein
MPLTYFKCKKCFRTFDTYGEARTCEKAHLRPVSAKAVRYTIKPYPYTIEITLTGVPADACADGVGVTAKNESTTRTTRAAESARKGDDENCRNS